MYYKGEHTRHYSSVITHFCDKNIMRPDNSANSSYSYSELNIDFLASTHDFEGMSLMVLYQLND